MNLSINTFATVQECDLLIIEKDTIRLQTFPLEDLELKSTPFGLSKTTAPCTACWRGYKAIWRIKDNKLFLEKIERSYYDNKRGEENIKELFCK